MNDISQASLPDVDLFEDGGSPSGDSGWITEGTNSFGEVSVENSQIGTPSEGLETLADNTNTVSGELFPNFPTGSVYPGKIAPTPYQENRHPIEVLEYQNNN